MTKKPQLRGQNLLDAIEICLRQLANGNEKYVYNASELARFVGCSRPTLDSKAEFIDKVLTKLGAEKRLKSDHPLIEQFHTRIEYLEAEKKALEKELHALRVHHASIYSTLYLESVNAAVLIKPIIQDESVAAGGCILCGHTLSADFEFPASKSVVRLDDYRND